jgi:hypothetical protein
MSRTDIEGLRGVRRTDAPVEELEAAAEALDWRCFVIDGSEVEDRESFLEACDEAFELPEWFGMNWDALEESLGDLELDGATGVVVLWHGWSVFADASPKDFAVALDVLRSAARGWTADGLAGGALLVGEGPDLDVEEL